MVSKKSKKNKNIFFVLFLIGKLGKKVAVFDWELGRNSAPRARRNTLIHSQRRSQMIKVSLPIAMHVGLFFSCI